MTKIIIKVEGLSVKAVAAEAADAYDDAYGMTDDGLPTVVYRPHNRVRGNSRRYPEFWFGSRRTE